MATYSVRDDSYRSASFVFGSHKRPETDVKVYRVVQEDGAVMSSWKERGAAEREAERLMEETKGLSIADLQNEEADNE